MKKLAGIIAESFVFRRGQQLLENNKRDWNYPLSKVDKLVLGVYMILSDYSKGLFPPTHHDEKVTFEKEIAFNETLKTLGKTDEELWLGAMRKPFWFGPTCSKYLKEFGLVQELFYACGVKSTDRLLEVGCGPGWMSEFFATAGFKVLATSVDNKESHLIEQRQKSLEIKRLPAQLAFRSAPMEYIHEKVRDLPPFDVVYVYEALHHAHDWKKSIHSFHKTLAPGGRCFILNEPNLLHTFVSYRVGRLSDTHEIGMSSSAMQEEMRRAGFRNVRVLRNRFHFWTKHIWLIGEK